MTDTSIILRMIGFVAVIATFTVFLGQWQPNGMTVPGWNDLMSLTRQDPLRGMPPWPVFQPPTGGTSPGGQQCEWWNLPCHAANAASSVASATAWLAAGVFYIAQIGYVIGAGIFSFLSWFFSLVVALFRSILSVVSFTYDGMPPNVQIILWAIVVPFWVAVALISLRLVRGISA